MTTDRTPTLAHLRDEARLTARLVAKSPDRIEATEWLTARYHEQVATYPRTANVPLILNITRNLATTIRLLRDKRVAS